MCALFGKTRHALYDHQWRRQKELLHDDIILQHVEQQRKILPRLGTRKLHYLIGPQLASHNIRIGRDYLFELLNRHKLLIRQRKRKVITTNSRHWMHKYSNLTTELICHRPEQLWVSDITYIGMPNQWAYLSLVTDAYSRKIMGFALRTDMSTQGCMEALQMALVNRQYPQSELIHHSDRGSQYCSAAYVELLNKQSIAISMTQNGDPYENALAERMNGIIKSEFNLYYSNNGLKQTYELIKKSIMAYNSHRPHGSCDMLTPQVAHGRTGPLKKHWKTYRKRWETQKQNPKLGSLNVKQNQD